MAGISAGVARAFADLAGVPRRGNQLNQEQAANLFQAATYFVTVHKERLSVPVKVEIITKKVKQYIEGPVPPGRRNYRTKTKRIRRVTERSRPGEYPRADTGNLRNSVAIERTTLADIMRTGSIRIGYYQQGWYGAYLEVVYARRGLAATMRSLYRRLGALAGFNFRYEFIEVGPRR